MHEFLRNNRDELIARCKYKVSKRPRRAATEQQLANGVPLFLDQLTRTLEAEEANEAGESMRISGPSGGDSLALSEMGVAAAAHGGELLKLGFSVDQVVHDYGDLCQAITDLAFERDAPFAIDEFRTLNRCLDNAIADAVTEFSFQRDASLARDHDAAANRRLGFLVHELRNALGTATLAVAALEVGNMTMGGATGAVLKRSLSSLKILIDQSVEEVRSGRTHEASTFSVADFVADASTSAQWVAVAKDVVFSVVPVDPTLGVHGNRELLLAALGNVLQNAFKFTHPHTEVTLKAYAFGEHVLFDVLDHCGGLPTGSAEKMFTPFTQRSDDKSGLGLGLSIARNSVESDLGTLGVRDVPGVGCVFTFALPRHTLQ
jgi:signal transduction histidine kinase